MIQIKKWADWQPTCGARTWIKFHTKTLMSKTWRNGTDSDRALMVALMLLAALCDNEIPDDINYIKTFCHLDRVDLTYLLQAGFIEFVVEEQSDMFDEEKVEKKPKRKYKTKKKTTGISPEFNAFWKLYPKKVDKSRAYKSWCKKDCDQKVSLILSNLKKRMSVETEWSGGDGYKYVPYPATFINNERWNDEVVKTKAAGKPRDVSRQTR